MTPPFDLFVERVHTLLQAGYATLTPGDIKELNSWHEPDITATLAMRIQELIDERAVPGISRGWSVVDNWPENSPHLPLTKQPRAKKRKLPDLKFRFGGAREVFYFRFESKNLAGSGDYLDLISFKDGLGRFLRKVYGREDLAGGLLGHVQVGTSEIHAERVRAALAKEPKKYFVKSGGGWTAIAWKNGPKLCFRVTHTRKDGSRIEMYYSFLLFL